MSQNIFSIPTSQNQPAGIAIFRNILKESGVILQSGNEPNVITQEQALVVRDIEKYFDKNDSQVDIEQFFNGFKLFCKKEIYFRKSLLKTHFKKSSETSESNLVIDQDSLFRILLKVKQLQSQVIEILIEEIITASIEDDQDTSWLRLLLSPLRYLPYMEDSKYLTNKLLDVIDIATFPAQLEILDSIPEILPDGEYEEVAKQLSKLLNQDNELSAAIIDCLNALNLNPEMRTQVQDHVLSKISSGTSLKTFPILLEFLLTDYKSQMLPQILLKIRNALDLIMPSSDMDSSKESQSNIDKNKEKESVRVLIFGKLQILSTTPKIIPETWIKVLNNVQSDHKPIDLLLLFMLHCTVKSKKRTIENLIQKKIKIGQIKYILIEKLFEKYIPQQLLRNYFSSIIEIASNLIRNSTSNAIFEFASALFTIVFNHKHSDTILRREIIDRLILLTGTNDQKSISAVLTILTTLLNDITKLQHHTVLLMRFLEKLDSFKLFDLKQVFEILCSLTCGETADEVVSGLKDEIHMIIRKQLSSSRKNLKHRGIIAAVVMAKHIASNSATDESELSESSESTSSSIIHVPLGKMKEATTLLELIVACISGNPHFTGLYYDELASMLMNPQNLHKTFMTWLNEIMTINFQNIYVKENVSEVINDLEFSMQYNLNTTDEIDELIAVNIGLLAVNSDENNSILILSPHFRLIRLLHYIKHDGDLASIDALLGCGVILPNTDTILELSMDQVKIVADCLFYCINWFREIINGFVTQKSKKLRYKVSQRLIDLIELERILETCMKLVPHHKLPCSYFDTYSQKNVAVVEKIKPPPRKKLKPSQTINDTTIASTASTIPSSKKTVTISSKKQNININFREIDTDIVILLKYPILDEVSSEERVILNLDQLEFILTDFVKKLTTLTKGEKNGLSHLNNIAPIDLIKDCVNILPNINEHLKVVIDKINELLEENDGRYDLREMYTESAEQLKNCFNLILQALSTIFNWSGLQQPKNLGLVRDLLKSLKPDEESLNSANKLSIDLVNRLGNYVDQCPYLSHAVHLISIMHGLYSITANAEIRSKIVAVSEELLQKRWYSSNGKLDTGKVCFENINILVRAYLDGAKVKTICGLVGTLQNQVSQLQRTDDCLHMLASIDKSNFHVFYKGLCDALHARIKTEIQSLTNNQHLVVWRTTALTLQGLMSVAKTREAKSLFLYFLKKSVAILKVFLSHGIPILEIMLRSKPDQVVEIFKIMQTTTRFLHHLCCYSKLNRDVNLVSCVPHFRLTLETLVYRVKAALVANNCSAAFWMGNLRNRDLQGEDIISQSTTTSSSDDDNININEDGEELLLDNDDDDTDIEEESNVENSSKSSSTSEVFD